MRWLSSSSIHQLFALCLFWRVSLLTVCVGATEIWRTFQSNWWNVTYILNSIDFPILTFLNVHSLAASRIDFRPYTDFLFNFYQSWASVADLAPGRVCTTALRSLLCAAQKHLFQTYAQKASVFEHQRLHMIAKIWWRKFCCWRWGSAQVTEP